MGREVKTAQVCTKEKENKRRKNLYNSIPIYNKTICWLYKLQKKYFQNSIKMKYNYQWETNKKLFTSLDTTRKLVH